MPMTGERYFGLFFLIPSNIPCFFFVIFLADDAFCQADIHQNGDKSEN